MLIRHALPVEPKKRQPFITVEYGNYIVWSIFKLLEASTYNVAVYVEFDIIKLPVNVVFPLVAV